MIPSYLYIATFPTGSNYICNPPVTDTDIDQMFLVSNLEATHDFLIYGDWVPCSSDEYPLEKWAAYRKNKWNALITDNPNYFLKFHKATELAKERNLLNKEDRIKLFDEIMNDR